MFRTLGCSTTLSFPKRLDLLADHCALGKEYGGVEKYLVVWLTS